MPYSLLLSLYNLRSFVVKILPFKHFQKFSHLKNEHKLARMHFLTRQSFLFGIDLFFFTCD